MLNTKRERNSRERKTVLCSLHFIGKCPKTSQTCHYAHGMEELRPTNWDTPGVRKNAKGYWENAYTLSRR